MSLTMTTDAAFADDVLAESLPVLVEFTAEWCPPCHRLKPVLEQIAESEKSRMRVVALDVDTDPQTAMKYQVLGMPTLALFVGGEIVARFTGARPRAAIMRELEPHLGASAGVAR
ncbi:thioredoxin family protein [Phytomonospora endophytica]|uniref:Thioredoxin n=1 Tax=Phytomonospora endophytica TaxID=714109 RepID=A0A841FA86_9ACTN|nr:thioredoxin family protein [Phytomonospora endophytica]MBB6033166.1 thioredoxin 1 [Phytomonospora endophytica]GIG65391.1 thioredoxin [Phytomonospora endophytica]